MTRTLLLAAAATVALGASAHAQGRDQIRIVGSSTVFPFATTVAERFGQKTQFPTPVIESTGSGGGIQLFCQGVGANTPDITNASRPIKQSELDMCAENGVEEVTEVKIGYDGIVIADANKGQPLDLTREQVFLALARQVPNPDGEGLVDNPYTNWSEIDESLQDRPIEVLGPPPTSGTRDAFVELVFEEACETFDVYESLSEEEQDSFCGAVREDGAYVEAGENDNLIVNKLTENRDAIGIFGYSFLDQNRDQIEGANIEGNPPTFENIKSGAYPVSRSLFFYVKDAHVGVIPGIPAYVDEFTSDDAIGPDGYLIDRGLIPLPEDEMEQVRSNVQPITDQQAQDQG